VPTASGSLNDNWYFSQYRTAESRRILRAVSDAHSIDCPEQYRAKTEEILRSFFERQISFPECIAALDIALAEFIPKLATGQIESLRAIILTNNETVMEEMARRGLHHVISWPCAPLH